MKRNKAVTVRYHPTELDVHVGENFVGGNQVYEQHFSCQSHGLEELVFHIIMPERDMVAWQS